MKIQLSKIEKKTNQKPKVISNVHGVIRRGEGTLFSLFDRIPPWSLVRVLKSTMRLLGKSRQDSSAYTATALI